MINISVTFEVMATPLKKETENSNKGLALFGKFFIGENKCKGYKNELNHNSSFNNIIKKCKFNIRNMFFKII